MKTSHLSAQDIKSSVPPLSFYQSRLPDLKPGNGWVDGGLCPFHADNHAGSFRVNTDSGAFLCYSCDAKGGDIIDFTMQLDGVSFKEAINSITGGDYPEIIRPIESVKHRIFDGEILSKDAKEKAAWMWNKASEEVDHPYADRKIIVPFGARQLGDKILVPMYFDDELVNVQRIYEDGNKYPLKDGKAKDCYSPIGRLKKKLFIAEGWATACTLHFEMNEAVVIAFTCNNLMSVAKRYRKKYPDLDIVMAADNDCHRENNPGVTHARAAAEAIGALTIIPEFPDGGHGDFNDFVNMGGVL